MVALDEVIAFLDRELNIAGIADYPGAMNGLQLANAGRIGRVVAAVDASLPVIEKAARGGPGLLIVHHGMFWQGTQPVTGSFYRKLKVAMDAGLAIYSSHLPLDIHPLWGNNRQLGEAIGLEGLTPFHEQKGQFMGLRGKWPKTRESLQTRLESTLAGRVHLCPAGPPKNLDVGIITGGAGSEVATVAASGIDTFVTGEGPHWSFPLAEELGLNVFYGGHYATETWGVRAVSAVIGETFGLPWAFIDHPTGL